MYPSASRLRLQRLWPLPLREEHKLVYNVRKHYATKKYWILRRAKWAIYTRYTVVLGSEVKVMWAGEVDRMVESKKYI
jgi:hypothetical protein